MKEEMACSKPRLLFLFLLVFFVVSTLFLPSHGDDVPINLLSADGTNEISGILNAAENSTKNSTSSELLVLAAERTHRIDPLDGFRYYTGGWNFSNPNYIASVVYSAMAPIALAGIWLLVFGIILAVLCFRRCCCTRKQYGYSKFCFFITILLLFVFTLAAIVGIMALYKGEKNFQSSIVDTVSYILNEANRVILNLQELLLHLREAQNIGVGPLSLPDEWKMEIDNRANLMDSVANKFRNVTATENSQITSYTEPLRSVLFCLATAMLAVAITGLLFSILGMECLVYCLGVIGWLLVAVALIFAGIFMLFHNVVTDTRVAVDEWLANPTANSAIENIIPRVDNQTAKNISHVTKGVTYNLILLVNKVITNVSNEDLPPDLGPPVYYNQSGPLIPLYCNPYDDGLNDAKCKENEVTFNNVSEVWKNYVCQLSDTGICTTQGRLTPSLYSQFLNSVNVSQGLVKGMPFVLELIDTSYLQKILGVLSKNYCTKLESYTKILYIAFFVSSFGVMFSIVFWFIYVHQRRHRAYTLKIDKKVKKGLFGY